MCEVVSASTMAYASLAATVASTAVSYMGAQQQAAAQSSAASYQAAVARNNAIIAQRNADATLQAGQAAEQQQRLKTAKLLGSQRAAMAANGVRLDEGSALDVQADTATLGELDALTVRNNYARQAYGYQTQSGNFTAQAQLDDAQAKWAKSPLTGMGSLLGGAGALANQWATYDKQGLL